MALELRCPNHPFYTGKRKPKGSSVNDPDAWELYRLKNPDKVNEKDLLAIPEYLNKAKEAA